MASPIVKTFDPEPQNGDHRLSMEKTDGRRLKFLLNWR